MGFLPRLARKMTDDDDSDDTHVVHAACSPELLETDSAYKYVLEKGKNIAPMPEELARAGRKIYWRVDTHPAASSSSSSSVLRGNVWEYTYVDPYSDENAQPEPPGRSKPFPHRSSICLGNKFHRNSRPYPKSPSTPKITTNGTPSRRQKYASASPMRLWVSVRCNCVW